MASKAQMQMVGQTCSEYLEETDGGEGRSCETCSWWGGELKLCKINLFRTQLESLDQT